MPSRTSFPTATSTLAVPKTMNRYKDLGTNLGEGTFGEVKVVQDKESGEKVRVDKRREIAGTKNCPSHQKVAATASPQMHQASRRTLRLFRIYFNTRNTNSGRTDAAY